ncbi:RNA-binding S4 domain-containing protein [Sinimarinibacterium sp. CAU 1509]|uniref:RNA-binding S4 domain-containing protein n=1 Tax=Sinimarinibacterium sp. CAU 1509 TaxID=2562283 RepID=UPI0010ACDE28|nr:RNA-binding S4 domain-containing protein [Sinimarinibacterium sp. CAU 1509]TJY61896.1 RNA-binding S4 domain-containing protein [Sinimarinibacterium sp. CAU 1509]
MSSSGNSAAGEAPRVRLDKWLWAARFYKTRTLAKQAIESGHVRYDGERCKVSKEVAVGARIAVRRGWDDQEVRVRALSDVRRGAPEAQLLYLETDESVQRRESQRLERQAAQQAAGPDRPTKQQRRLLQKLKRSMFE